MAYMSRRLGPYVAHRKDTPTSDSVGPSADGLAALHGLQVRGCSWGTDSLILLCRLEPKSLHCSCTWRTWLTRMLLAMSFPNSCARLRDKHVEKSE